MPKAEEANEVAATNRARVMLLEFLSEYDAPCPVCEYNLRALTKPICPECGHDLVLTVGTSRVRLGWLLAAVAPGFFSGISAFFMLIPIVARVVMGDGKLSWPLIVLDVFGWSSGLFAIVLGAKRGRFLSQSRARQRWWTLGIWFVHVAALGIFLFVGFWYL